MDFFIKCIEIVGTLAFAWSGIIEARKKQMDLVGLYSVAMITAIGGGTVRDILIDQYPLFWIAQPEYPMMIFILCLVAALFRQRSFSRPWAQRGVLILDALGVGLFTATGCYRAYQAGTGVFVAILMGVVTCVFGGVVRDIICNEVPVVFQRSELYATCSFIGGALYMGVILLGGDPMAATLGCILTVTALRIAAMRYRLTLPI
ncbi:trimeric intracellular cation channel family protein [Chloroflexia bacterium SDU3-3]|nr:trimeric intracellular cation channel family protein [Chloroflexia bacterium SDU3-3]